MHRTISKALNRILLSFALLINIEENLNYIIIYFDCCHVMCMFHILVLRNIGVKNNVQNV